jgi:hypothetical protein
MAIEIVSFPMKNGDFPQFFVCLPEDNHDIIISHYMGYITTIPPPTIII